MYPPQEAVVTESSRFRVYAQEAMRDASKAKNEEETLALHELALTWAQAALASDRVFGSSVILPPRGAREATH